jgi:hypothetical protein
LTTPISTGASGVGLKVYLDGVRGTDEDRKALGADNMRGGGQVIPGGEEFDNAYLHGSEWGRIESLLGRRP